jgi:hypothetical protein
MRIKHDVEPTTIEAEGVKWEEMLETEGVYRLEGMLGTHLEHARFIVLNHSADNAIYVEDGSAVEAYPPAWKSHTFIKTKEKVYLSIR